jgi:CheY-like chemotaxis protein
MGSEIKILVVDPEGSSTLLLLRTLTSWGYSGYSVSTGEDTLKTIPEYEPHLILLSNELSGLTAKIVLRWIRIRFPKLPVIVISESTEVRTVVEMMKVGASDYLAKPLDLNELQQLIARYLKEAESMEIKGNLELQPVAEIFQIFEQSGKSGILNMSLGFQQGHITVFEGRVSDGSLGKMFGLKALLRMICWQKGFFNFCEQPVPPKVSIPLNTEELLFESMRYYDDLNSLITQLPPLNAPLAIDYPSPLPELTPEEKEILSLQKRGQRITIQRLLDESPLDDREVLRICIRLLEKACLKLSSSGLGYETSTLTVEPLFGEEELDYLKKLHEYRTIQSNEFKICALSTSRAMAASFLSRLRCMIYEVADMENALEGKRRLSENKALLVQVLYYNNDSKILWKDFTLETYGFVLLLDSLEIHQKNWLLQGRAVHIANANLPVSALVSDDQIQMMASITGILPKQVTYDKLGQGTDVDHIVRRIFLEAQWE